MNYHDYFVCDKSWYQIHVTLTHSDQHRAVNWNPDDEESWDHQKSFEWTQMFLSQAHWHWELMFSLSNFFLSAQL